MRGWFGRDRTDDLSRVEILKAIWDLPVIRPTTNVLSFTRGVDVQPRRTDRIGTTASRNTLRESA